MASELLHALSIRDGDGSAPECDAGNGFDGRMGVRISSVFVILVGSTMGAIFPILASRMKLGAGFLSWAFFIAKYFGSGVIIATSFIHLLGPAEEALRNPCLTGPITEYSWTEAIILMTIVVLFFVEFMVMRFSSFGQDHQHDSDHESSDERLQVIEAAPAGGGGLDETKGQLPNTNQLNHVHDDSKGHIPGESQLDQNRDVEVAVKKPGHSENEEYAAQLTSIFILEFGIIFHSVFIGLTLAVSGSEFITLYIVLVFHQTFEGLGLGARLATVPFPHNKRHTPYFLGLAYGLSTPIAISIGLGVRNGYPPEGRTTLIVNGVFDSVSAGILIYTALIELMAHEFMFSPSMNKAPLKTVLSAFLLLSLGAGLMAVLGEWA